MDISSNFYNSARLQPFSIEEKGFFDKIAHTNRMHPILTKVTAVFFLALGIALLATIPVAQPLGAWVIPTFSVIGSVDVLVSLLALGMLGIMDYTTAPHHPMTHHVFEERKVNRDDMEGELKYVDNIPVLTIEHAENHYAAGKTFGYLTGKETAYLIKKFRSFRHLIGLPCAQEIPAVIAELKKHIPAEYLEEIQGFVEGYNQWIQEKGKGEPVTTEELLVYHLLPDSCHFGFRETSVKLQNENSLRPVMACTALAARDSEHGMILGRNLDWASFGLLGTYSLVVTRNKSDGSSITGVTLPGIHGTLTGMNSNGLCVAMNVAPPLAERTDVIEGMPALFFNRYCLENSTNVDSASVFIDSYERRPLGPYHLSLVDEQNACTYSFYQGNPHLVRRLQNSDPFLCTTNFCFKEDGTVRREMFSSKAREERINELFNYAQRANPNTSKRELVQYALALPQVNNSITVHSIVFYPKERRFDLVMDNSFAAHSKRSSLHPFRISSTR